MGGRWGFLVTPSKGHNDRFMHICHGRADEQSSSVELESGGGKDKVEREESHSVANATAAALHVIRFAALSGIWTQLTRWEEFRGLVMYGCVLHTKLNWVYRLL